MPNTVTTLTTSGPYQHVIRQGDTLPVMSATLTGDDGNPVLLTGKTVTFRMRAMQTKATMSLTGTCTVVSATNGQVQFAFSSADTQQYGLYEGEFVVTTTNTSDVESFPNNGFLNICVTKGI